MQLNINNLQLQTSNTGSTPVTSNNAASSHQNVSGSNASLHSAESTPLTSTPKSADVSRNDNQTAEKKTSAEERQVSQARTQTGVQAGTQNSRGTENLADAAQIEQLATRDREVRQHEQAHASAGGQYTGSPSYEYTKGPDGRLYAVSGEVSIDTSAVANDPEATLEKAEVVLRAALAVSEPSGADRAVAAKASALAEQARAELSGQVAPGEGRADLSRTGSSSETDESGTEDSLKVNSERNDIDRIEQPVQLRGEQADELRNEQREEAEANALRRQGAIEDIRVDMESQVAAVAESLDDYNKRLDEVGERFAEINQRLVDAGVFKKIFPEGLIIDQNV